MDDGATELVVRRLVVEPSEVHRGLALRDGLCAGPDVGPGAAGIERDPDVGVAWGVAVHELEG